MPDTMLRNPVETGAPQPGRTAPDFDAIVIGAGFSGLYQLHLLRDLLGLAVQGFETADGVGGTWFWNRYPGARCDSESYSYSYSFSRELEQEWSWTEKYPQQPEVMRYLNHVADRFDLRRSFRFKTRVAAAEWDAASGHWRIRTEAGETLTATFLITAVGCLSTTNVPAIPGLETFGGRWYHTGQWPHEGVDFAGQRVGLIGTGSTGIQAVPVIAEQAGQLTVFQRTANYSVPARNHPLSEAVQRQTKADYAEIRRTMRETTNGHPFRITDRSVFDVSDEEREAIFEAAWAEGGLQFRAGFRDILTDPAANATAADFIRRKIREIVHDPAVADILTDFDHPYAAKRPPIDTEYFEAFNRTNVTLVDVKAAPIQAIVPEGVRTADATYTLDIIVFATGFDAMTGPFLRIDIKGRDGLSLREAWKAGPRTYLGLQVAGFPNLFTITGPGSPSVLCNMPVPIEQHAEWIAGCIAHMRENGIAQVEPAPEAVERWVAHVNEVAAQTLLPQASSSWYLGANVPGKPRVFMPYAGGMARYRGICDDVAANGYEGFVFTASAMA